jgi:TonB family protein
MQLRKRIDMVANTEFIRKLAKVDTLDFEIQALIKVADIFPKKEIADTKESFESKSLVTSVMVNKAKVCEPMTMDSLRDPFDISLTIQKETLPSINFMYRRLLRQENKQVDGAITVEFSINSFGTVETAKILVSTVNDTIIENRVIDLIQKTKFNKVDNSVGSTSVVFPFTFASN